MARRVGHVHKMRLVSHTTEATGKDVRGLLSCACGAKVDVIRPHQGRKEDPAFFAKLAEYEHLCCDSLPTLESQGTEPPPAPKFTLTLPRIG